MAGPALRPGLDHDRVACRVGHALDRESATVVQRLLFDDFQVQLPDDYLTKVDVASMLLAQNSGQIDLIIQFRGHNYTKPQFEPEDQPKPGVVITLAIPMFLQFAQDSL